MRALITGASGCLGRALIPELAAQGWDLRTTARTPVDLPGFVAARLERDDLAPLVEGVDAIFHCAAMSGGWGSPQAFHEANVTATRRLLDAARVTGVARFVFASTPSLYADGTDRAQLSEDAPLPARALSPYASTKRQAEALVLAQDGPALRCTAIRPRAIYGRHDRALLPRLRAVLARGVLPLIAGGRAQIDLTHRSDAARAMRLAAAGPGGRVWNVTSGEVFAFRDLAALVCDRGGYDPRRVPMPYGLAYALAGASERAALLFGKGEPALTRQAVVSLGRSLTLDIRAARRDLGYVPQVTLKEGLDECFA
ncbi:NAD-dependent epimerase/dehydratase family protein [Mesobaculum littorinae]|uniref:NAD-dependent epimerase/dehydratase family protein n=1 Tax=Mesobaculum littorinae TaxID=2486419 RepID=A0A438AFD2_9RHOB|nr:NAD-dependent epimerase/dehydratase family protein [Mesobaculum littorinae]RVV97305.1 NAD-dependent epimerase/dehydratase family protein [Mesobaculum littorinae]